MADTKVKAKVKVEPKKKPIKMQGGDNGVLSKKVRIIIKTKTSDK